MLDVYLMCTKSVVFLRTTKVHCVFLMLVLMNCPATRGCICHNTRQEITFQAHKKLLCTPGMNSAVKVDNMDVFTLFWVGCEGAFFILVLA